MHTCPRQYSGFIGKTSVLSENISHTGSKGQYTSVLCKQHYMPGAMYC